MSWAKRAIDELREGRQATIKPHGGSMRPRVESGASVTLEPCDAARASPGDIVLCRVAGNVYLHLVGAVEGSGEDRRVRIENMRGRVNGWTRAVYGRAIHIENP